MTRPPSTADLHAVGVVDAPGAEECPRDLRKSLRGRLVPVRLLFQVAEASATIAFLFVFFVLLVVAVRWARGREENRTARMDLAIELYEQLWEHYPHWDTVSMGPGELWSKYRPRLEAADRACGASDRPCAAYLRTLRDMFAELRNGHTEILVEHEIGSPRIAIEPIEGRAVITDVERGSDAEDLGLEVGMEILAVDGLSAKEALDRVPRWRVAFASPRMRSYAAYQALLDGAGNGEVRVTVKGKDASPRIVALQRAPIRYEWELAEDGVVEEEDPPVRGGRTGDGLAYVRLEGFEGESLEADFDRVLDAAIESPGLILDLRDNYGGVLQDAFRVLGRLFPQSFTIGEHCTPRRDKSGGAECTEHRIEPHGKIYEGPIAVLIDENVYSAGELAAGALCRTGRARCFGRTTAGETDCVFRVDLPGGVARMSWAEFRPAFGPSLLGVGLAPDVAVERTLADLRSGRDAEYEAAREWLLAERADAALSAAAGPAGNPSRGSRSPEAPSGRTLATSRAKDADPGRGR